MPYPHLCESQRHQNPLGWSNAGKLKNGEPYEVDDPDGNHTYLSIKVHLNGVRKFNLNKSGSTVPLITHPWRRYYDTSKPVKLNAT
jgi:hypothetical protein